MFKKLLFLCSKNISEKHSFSVFLSSCQLQHLLKDVERHKLHALFILLCLQKSDSFLWCLITVWVRDDLINDHLLSAVILCLTEIFSLHRISLIVESLNRKTVSETNCSLSSQIWNSDDLSTQSVFEWQQQQCQLREFRDIKRWERKEWETDSSKERDWDNHYKNSDYESRKKRQVIDVKITVDSERERNEQNM